MVGWMLYVGVRDEVSLGGITVSQEYRAIYTSIPKSDTPSYYLKTYYRRWRLKSTDLETNPWTARLLAVRENSFAYGERLQKCQGRITYGNHHWLHQSWKSWLVHRFSNKSAQEYKLDQDEEI